MLAKMRYKGFVWPNNPSVFEAEQSLSLCRLKYPFSGFSVQELGLRHRLFKGEGEFSGSDAYDSFRRLANCFREGGAGWLYHPVWPPVRVYFSRLKMKQSPKPEYISYSFEFTECGGEMSAEPAPPLDLAEGETRYVPAAQNETLAALAERLGVTPAELAASNPQIAEGAVLEEGQLVRLG